MEFPSLAEVLAVDTASMQQAGVEEESPEDAMESKLAALREAKDKEFRDFCDNSPSRIYCPNNDVTYLDGLFEQFESADKKNVRVLHLGDSQLEGDRMTSALREHFQETFGGQGVGMVPAVQMVPTYTLRQSVTPSTLPRYMAYGPKDWHASHNRYGVMAQMSRVDGTATFTFTCNGNENFPHSQRFSKVAVYAMGEGSIVARIGGEMLELKPESDKKDEARFFSVKLPKAATAATVTINGHMDVFGILLDGLRGVSMDNVPMRGSSGTMFTNISRNTMEPFFRNQNVGLIILQYGGNSTPYLTSAAKIESYKKQMKQQIAYFRSLSPRSKILFIGPADMATSIGGKRQSYPELPNIVKALREAANEEGAAFWDMFSTMGGMNSMVKWADEAQPALAGHDYIHFTRLGAQKMTDYLFETLQLYYKFYRFRTGKDKVELPADTLQVDSAKVDSVKNDTI